LRPFRRAPAANIFRACFSLPTANSHRGLSGIILRARIFVFIRSTPRERRVGDRFWTEKKLHRLDIIRSPPVREEKQRGQRDGQLELSPVPDEIRNESHAHVTQIEWYVMQRADHGPPFSAHYFHGCNSSRTHEITSYL